MNLKSFLSYNEKCPICGDCNFYTYFHSNRRQKYRINENNYEFLFSLGGLKKQKDYKVGYCVDLDNNDLKIEFYTKDMNHFKNHVNTGIISRFLDFQLNLGQFRLLKRCESCDRYYYSSSYLDIDIKSATIGDIEIEDENFSCIKKSDTSIAYQIFNNLITKTTEISIYKIDDEFDATFGSIISARTKSSLDMPLLNFSSETEIVNKLSKIIIFS